MKDKIIEEINSIYPPMFIHETSYGVGVMKRGKREATHIRRLTQDEEDVINNIISILT